MTDFFTMANTIVGNIDIACERQSERDYFWAVAFDLDRELIPDWAEFTKPPVMFFEEIHQIISDFNDEVDDLYDAERVEVFVAGQIWIEKIGAGSVLNLEFLPYLRISPLARWASHGETN